MIYVTQGHENGVGLEIFLKSILCLKKDHLKEFKLFVNEQALESTLKSCKINYKIKTNLLCLENSRLNLEIFEKSNIPESTESLNLALNKINKDDILLTLPTSKDQLIFKGKLVNGYTDFFRKKYNDPSITMNFLSHKQNVMLLTDHISINQITKILTENFIQDKVSTTLKSLNYIRPIRDVYFAGIEPHCGENGQISTADTVFNSLIPKLKEKFANINFFGPYPADTLHLKYEDRKDQLFIYPAHDQGLAPFKLNNGLVGINLSLGLPFKRVSVDHGTAFDLYGKNRANYLSMLYLLEEILNWT